MNHSSSTNKQPTKLPKKISPTRKALCSALLSLLERRAFEHITVKEITAHANVGYATFFRQYKDKEELLHELTAQEIHKLLAMTLPVLYTVDSLASNQALCTYVFTHRKLWKTLLTGGASAILREEFLSQALQLAKDNPRTDVRLPDSLTVTFAVTSSLEILAWWLKQSTPLTARQMAQIINQLVIAPIYPTSTKTQGN